MGAKVDDRTQVGASGVAKPPRTPRGERTLRKILDAAREEFGERGFSDSSIVGITQRAGVALGTFYTYFDSKEALFQALVRDMSAQVRDNVGPALVGAADGLDGERRALAAFLDFVRDHRDIYRIIDESEFVDPESFRLHYAVTADRIAARLKAAAERGEVQPDVSEIHAWAIMGMNVFLGLRYGVWEDDASPDQVADAIADMLAHGIGAR